MDLESVAFGMMLAGTSMVRSGEISDTDTLADALVDALQRRMGVSEFEAQAALARACRKMKDRSCN